MEDLPKCNGTLEVEKEKDWKVDASLSCYGVPNGLPKTSGKFGMKLILMLKTGHRYDKFKQEKQPMYLLDLC